MSCFAERLRLFASCAHEIVPKIQRGIEKESLRIAPDGRLSKKDHPRQLGSALTHPYITTDYSEALLELVTPTFHTVEATLAHLTELHQIVYRHIGDEALWTTSLPCLLDKDSEIPIAKFGDSNVGKMKRIYRQGLSLRYGSAMQVISGIHYNLSMPEEFWHALGIVNDDSGREAISDAYMAGIRNFHRYCWLVFFLFGASPAACASFFRASDIGSLSKFDTHTVYGPYSTSLRMSNYGYRNPVQSEIHIDHNSIAGYIATLSETIETPYREYEKFGVKVDGEYRQLNSNLLQIENEYYSVIRPKRRTLPLEKPTVALKKRGVEYLEIRCLDLDPFDPIGISVSQAKFMEVLIAYCLLLPSPSFSELHPSIIAGNKDISVLQGRNPDCKLSNNGNSATLQSWGQELMEDLHEVAGVFDAAMGESGYCDCVKEQSNKLNNPNDTPSGMIIEQLRSSGDPFFTFALKQSAESRRTIAQMPLGSDVVGKYASLAKESIEKQMSIESADRDDFDSFLQRYFGT